MTELSFDTWNNLITQKGIDHKPTEKITELAQSLYPQKLTRLQRQLNQLNNPSAAQLADYQIKLATLETERRPLHDKIVSLIKGEERDNLVAQIGELDGEINQVLDIIGIPDRIISLTEKIDRIKEKLACCLKEIEFREKKLVKRKIIGTTYYLDFTVSTAVLTGTVTFTNASETVTGVSTLFSTELAVGNYIRASAGVQWYRVTVIASDTSLTITPVFQQTTVTDTAGATKKNSNNGTTTALAFAHPNQYTTNTVRTAGDILKVRANQTHTIKGVSILCDEDGTVANYIEIRGCSVADDPWSDASDVKPIFTFGDTAFYIDIGSDDYWKFNRLEVMESSSTNGQIYVSNSSDFLSINVDSHDCSSASGVGFKFSLGSAIIDGGSAYGNLKYNIYDSGSHIVIKGGFSAYGGAATTDDGVYNTYGFIELENVTLGAGTTHDVDDLYADRVGRILGRNVTLNSATEAQIPTTYLGAGSWIKIEDYDGTKLASKSWYHNGIIQKDTGVIRTGGASSSAKVSPNTLCGLNYPLCIGGTDELCDDFVIWCPASATTVTIYIRSLGIWTTYPTASELYIQAEYYDGATATRAKSTASTQVLTDETTWVAFTTTFTPNSAAWAYVKVYLKKYEASKGIYVDVKPVVA